MLLLLCLDELYKEPSSEPSSIPSEQPSTKPSSCTKPSRNPLLSGTATQSSTYRDGVPHRAIDGNYEQDYDRYYGTHAAAGDTNQWSKMDLNVGSSGAAVFKVVVWNRSGSTCVRLDGAIVDFGDGSVQSRTV